MPKPKLFYPDKRYFFHVRRIEDIDISMLTDKGIRGTAFDLDGTVVRHNDYSANSCAQDWCAKLREANIDYCIYTYNRDRKHIYAVADQLQCQHIVIFDPLNFFDHFTHRLARELGIEPSRMAIVNDFYPPLLWARQLGCVSIKVKPFETEREKYDSLCLIALRYLDDKILEPHLTTHLST